MQRTSRRRRIITWISLSLLAGASVNALVAFRCGAVPSRTGRFVQFSRSESESLWHQYVGPIELGEELSAHRYDSWNVSEIRLIAMAGDLESGYRTAGCAIIESGWPMRTAQGDHYEAEAFSDGQWTRGATRSEGLLTVPRRIGPIRAGRRIPFRPIWTGLVVNTLFYALTLAVVSFAARLMRRRARLGRRLCAECSYDLRGSMTDTGARCPECGSEYEPSQLSIPRLLLCWWMVPLLLPVLAMAAYWSSGLTDWISLRYQFRWADPIATPLSFSSVGVLGFFVYLLGVWSYNDRPVGPRHMYAVAVALLLTPTSYASAFVLIVRLST